jgi:hypothetical protein
LAKASRAGRAGIILSGAATETFGGRFVSVIGIFGYQLELVF